MPDYTKGVCEEEGTTLASILAKRWPLDRAIILAAMILKGRYTLEDVEAFGDYRDKQTMAEALGNPNGWEFITWDVMYARHLQNQEFMGKGEGKGKNPGVNVDFVPILRQASGIDPGPTTTSTATSSTLEPVQPSSTPAQPNQQETPVETQPAPALSSTQGSEQVVIQEAAVSNP